MSNQIVTITQEIKLLLDDVLDAHSTYQELHSQYVSAFNEKRIAENKLSTYLAAHEDSQNPTILAFYTETGVLYRDRVFSTTDDGELEHGTAPFVAMVEGEVTNPNPVESLREAIQNAESEGLVRIEDGTVITGVVDTDDGIVLVTE